MARPRRPAPHVVLDDDQRQSLERLSRARKLPRRLVQRAKILLECAAGLPDSQVAVRLGTGSFSFQGLAKPRMAKAWPGVQPMRRIAAAMLVSPPLRSSPKTTLRNAAIT